MGSSLKLVQTTEFAKATRITFRVAVRGEGYW
jgi:hypothetical protein